MDFELRLAILKTYGTQMKAARALGIHQSRLSCLVTGYYLPWPEEAKRIREKLGVSLSVAQRKVRKPRRRSVVQQESTETETQRLIRD